MEDIEVVSNNPAWIGGMAAIRETFTFKPHFGWTGAIESRRRARTA
jgi:hypothetical protein